MLAVSSGTECEEAMDARCDEPELRALAQRGLGQLGPDASAQRLLEWTDSTFGSTYIVASSMQDAALVHLVADVRHDVDVLFLDTGYHFAETIGTRDAVVATYGVNLLNVLPEHSVAEQDQLLGENLFARDPDKCCRLRKVAPLARVLGGYNAWVTGIRRVDAPSRADTPLISFDETFGLVKINPIAAWSDDDLTSYIEAHDVLVNPLVAEGYPSIGCAPCTQRPEPGAASRSGRWAGLAKSECGLHATLR
jgi:phosphoadenosine phosphosulfate reductase